MKELFVWEIRKNLKRKALIGLSVAAIVILILLAVTYNLLTEAFKSIDSIAIDETIGAEAENKSEREGLINYIAKEDLEAEIQAIKERIAELEKEKEKGEEVYSALFEHKSLLASFEYAKQHGMYDKEVNIWGYNVTQTLKAEGFVGLYSAVIKVIVLIYGIILSAGLYCNEYRNGTIKLLMTRPVTKNRLTAAKLLSLYAILTVFYFLPTLIGFGYGAIAFGTEGTTEVICAFNGTSAYLTTLGALTFGELMIGYVNIMVMSTFSFALSTVTRNTAVGVVPSLIVIFGLGGLFESTGASAFLLSSSLEFMTYFGINSVPKLGNFFISLSVVVFWTVASLVGLFVVTNKRDVN